MKEFMLGFISTTIGFIIGFLQTRYDWQYEAAKRGFARYHPKTGKWEWNTGKWKWNAENEND